jgi:hypothetical protein
MVEQFQEAVPFCHEPVIESTLAVMYVASTANETASPSVGPHMV